MKGDVLDRAMDDFATGKAQVLLCTTIVESGLDIPNVNTIIIEEVQQFGLASLYQLRGRVGRAGRQAYAYMFHAEVGGYAPLVFQLAMSSSNITLSFDKPALS
jgi:transcription-repair coupling factor (superfamily II helicase)